MSVSDAKGAVISMSVPGLGAKGIAFFIPISDALARLTIELE